MVERGYPKLTIQLFERSNHVHTHTHTHTQFLVLASGVLVIIAEMTTP